MNKSVLIVLMLPNLSLLIAVGGFSMLLVQCTPSVSLHALLIYSIYYRPAIACWDLCTLKVHSCSGGVRHCIGIGLPTPAIAYRLQNMKIMCFTLPLDLAKSNSKAFI